MWPDGGLVNTTSGFHIVAEGFNNVDRVRLNSLNDERRNSLICPTYQGEL